MTSKRMAMVALVAAVGMTPAHAAVIDFEGRGAFFGFSVTYGDFRIRATSASFSVGNSSGSFALTPAPFAGPVALSRVDGTAFAFASADFFAADGNGLGVPITFDFTRADGTTGRYVLQTPEFGPGAAIPSTRFATDFANAFASITRVSWSNGAEFHQIDNLVVGSPTVSAVPEPGTWALTIAGFGAVGGVQRQRRRRIAVAV